MPPQDDTDLPSTQSLAARLAHEINNPLFAILGTVELLLEEVPGEPELHERLLRIRSSGEEIRDAVRRLVAESDASR